MDIPKSLSDQDKLRQGSSARTLFLLSDSINYCCFSPTSVIKLSALEHFHSHGTALFIATSSPKTSSHAKVPTSLTIYIIDFGLARPDSQGPFYRLTLSRNASARPTTVPHMRCRWCRTFFKVDTYDERSPVYASAWLVVQAGWSWMSIMELEGRF